MARRPFCADISWETDEPLAATASRIDHWVLLEYRGVWSRDLLDDSLLSDRLKGSLSEQIAALPRTRLLFIRRPERRADPKRLVYLARTREQESALFSLDLDDLDDLADLDIAAAFAGKEELAPVQHPLLAVCTHGKRDACCARYGRPLYDGLRDQAEEHWVWQASHVGGDRFAGNVVCLPEGLYYGRVTPAEAWPLLDHQLAGRIYLDRYRGRSCYSFPQQAAERAVRERLGAFGVEDVELAASARDGDGWRIAFRARETGDVYEAEIGVEQGELTYLTCDAEALRRPRRHVLRSLRLLEEESAESLRERGA